ncbi:putative lipoxygenase [Helianthus anomalus]
MLNSQINHSHPLNNLLPSRKAFVHGDTTNHSSSNAYSPANLRQHASTKKSNATHARSTSTVGNIKAISIPFLTKETTVKCVITVQPTISSALAGVGVGGVVDGVSDLLGLSFLLELVSNDLDCKYTRFL